MDPTSIDFQHWHRSFSEIKTRIHFDHLSPGALSQLCFVLLLLKTERHTCLQCECGHIVHDHANEEEEEDVDKTWGSPPGAEQVIATSPPHTDSRAPWKNGFSLRFWNTSMLCTSDSRAPWRTVFLGKFGTQTMLCTILPSLLFIFSCWDVPFSSKSFVWNIEAMRQDKRKIYSTVIMCKICLRTKMAIWQLLKQQSFGRNLKSPRGLWGMSGIQGCW